MAHGRFITLEGGEGAGKSTQIRRLAAKLEARGHVVVMTREPGGAPGAETIRELLVKGDTGRWTARTEALLHFAAREEHLARTIRPALGRGGWVISDRFVDSTMAYQGVAQGLGPDFIGKLRALVVGDDMPALTLILDLAPEIGLSRAMGRGTAGEDRYERMKPEFHQTLRQAFLDIAKNEPDRCAIIDAAQSEDAVAADIWAILQARLTV
ncbi:MAG: dTMP kinase [Alphaproteobacteria bacterium]|nr:dTMP kinase [Alphaproteobacteria bacterium]MDX5417065.1 dTMP kinase [Alphaproteobacteria bacterium]MDX5494470.1 dTMP kinase [Alphaproteobacteria bacterium]